MTFARIAALPFQVSGEHQVIANGTVTTTEERRHGVVRLEGTTLTVQWRVEREIQKFGVEIRTDVERDGMRSVPVRVDQLGDARVRTRGRWFWRTWELVLTARDLTAFDPLAGNDGFAFEHPAELVLPVRSADVELAREFASEVELAVAELALSAAERAAVPSPDPAADALPAAPPPAAHKALGPNSS
ncbi:hypothetical protein [Gemmatimonas sp.]|uniref:hypothetical protein n=1 Tax=Gemmatimonas sp. TaxID=1962908 RepID=UPI00333FA507